MFCRKKWKKGDLVLIILAVALIAAAVITFMFGGEASRHGML